MNTLDLVLLALLLLAAWSGYRRGALLVVLSFGGLLGGLFVGALLAPRLAGQASNPGTQIAWALGALLGGAVIGNIIGWIVGSRVRAAASDSVFRPVDRWGGLLVSAGALALTVWFITFNLVNGPFPGLAREIQASAVVRVLDAVLPEPPSLLAEARAFMNRFDFPQVFAGLPKLPGGPVGAPTEREASRAFRAADDSTVRVIGRACDRVQEGSGFVVAPSYVVTNAHVVAGVRSPSVEERSGASQDAATVLFDPSLDVAVLRIAETPGPVLQLADEDVGRGTGGAVLGYPGGGDLTASKAAVRQTIDAVGRDIYGKSRVTRQVYELQATVRPGNSGGPFVLPDGDAAGLVFAASTTDSGIGYAITSAEVQADVTQATGETTPVPTGPCVR